MACLPQFTPHAKQKSTGATGAGPLQHKLNVRTQHQGVCAHILHLRWPLSVQLCTVLNPDPDCLAQLVAGNWVCTALLPFKSWQARCWLQACAKCDALDGRYVLRCVCHVAAPAAGVVVQLQRYSRYPAHVSLVWQFDAAVSVRGSCLILCFTRAECSLQFAGAGPNLLARLGSSWNMSAHAL